MTDKQFSEIRLLFLWMVGLLTLIVAMLIVIDIRIVFVMQAIQAIK